MRVGIFGGTFDPPHLGHLILAAEAHFRMGLDRLLWVLTPFPPHKSARQITLLEHRLAMVQAAIEKDPQFILSRLEMDRPPPHYAVDTVKLVRAEHPDAELIYLIGGDSLYDMPTWHHPRDFVRACDVLGVMRRPGDQVGLRDLEAALPGLTPKVRFIDAPLLEISSRQIRQRIARGEPYRYYLLPAVYRYIEARGLYLVSSDRES